MNSECVFEIILNLSLYKCDFTIIKCDFLCLV